MNSSISLENFNLDLQNSPTKIGVWWASLDIDQKPGDHPNFKKNALRGKTPFSELSESSGAFSEQLSEFEIPFLENEIPFSENEIPRLEQYENHNSRSNSQSDSRN